MNITAQGSDLPVFSETFLYERIGKSDARFVLAVVEEYEALIRILGTKKIVELLEKK